MACVLIYISLEVLWTEDIIVAVALSEHAAENEERSINQRGKLRTDNAGKETYIP